MHILSYLGSHMHYVCLNCKYVKRNKEKILSVMVVYQKGCVNYILLLNKLPLT